MGLPQLLLVWVPRSLRQGLPGQQRRWFWQWWLFWLAGVVLLCSEGAAPENQGSWDVGGAEAAVSGLVHRLGRLGGESGRFFDFGSPGGHGGDRVPCFP